MITLYTTPTCGICRMVKIKLQQKNINYKEASVEQLAQVIDIQRAPVLQVEQTFFTSPTEIVNWINQQ